MKTEMSSRLRPGTSSGNPGHAMVGAAGPFLKKTNLGNKNFYCHNETCIDLLYLNRIKHL